MSAQLDFRPHSVPPFAIRHVARGLPFDEMMAHLKVDDVKAEYAEWFAARYRICENCAATVKISDNCEYCGGEAPCTS